MNKNIIKEIISWLMVIVIAVVLAIIINKTLVYNVEPTSGSMENTLMIGEKIVTYRQAYLFSDPKRKDIIVFKYPDNEEEIYIKRIIGLPGESVEGINGLVYINGEPLDEPYVMAKLEEDFGPYVVPADSYFMMGDNRSISFDSRSWVNKFVHKDKIFGKAIFKYPKFKILT